jgi:hypothetical protein
MYGWLTGGDIYVTGEQTGYTVPGVYGYLTQRHRDSEKLIVGATLVARFLRHTVLVLPSQNWSRCSTKVEPTIQRLYAFTSSRQKSLAVMACQTLSTGLVNLSPALENF